MERAERLVWSVIIVVLLVGLMAVAMGREGDRRELGEKRLMVMVDKVAVALDGVEARRKGTDTSARAAYTLHSQRLAKLEASAKLKRWKGF